MNGLNLWFKRRQRLAPVLLLLPFLLCALAMIPYPGLQNDELFFSGAIYRPGEAWYSAEIGSARIPLMVMSYTGALKTWIYQGLLYFFIPDRWTVRLPVVLMGLGTLWLTWIFTRRMAGGAAALATLALLSTDSTFLMTNTFDWGPVALQHLLLMGGLVALQQWLFSGLRKWLALGFFLWGLGMWDKALLAWPLGGLAVAAMIVWPRQVLAHCRPATLGVAIVSFLVGASPLVWYNIARRGETATQNARFTASAMPPKILALRQGIDGSGLWGYMVNKRAATGRRPPRTALERTYAAIARAAGVHYSNWMLAACILGLVCMALLIGSPPARLVFFLLLATAVAWAQMAFNAGTGGAPHHVVLLWPFPAIFLGVASMGLARKVGSWSMRAAAIVVAMFCIGNLLNMNEYLYNLSTVGPTGVWTDAIDRLARVLPNDRKVWIGAVDWGFLNGVQWLHDGGLQLFIASDQLNGPMTDQKRKEFREMVESPDRLFVRHTDDKQVFPAINQKFRAAAANAGFTERIERIVTDSNDRPVFVLFRMERAEPASN